MMFVFNVEEKPAPTEEYAEGFADGYTEALLENDVHDAVNQFAVALTNEFASRILDYAETDKRVEIPIVMNDFYESLHKILGCFEPAKEGASDGREE